MERCVFCGWTRKTAYPSIRFFAIPREPGLKRMQWYYALGKRELSPRDRVCSVHFRSGKPSSDPSHEDFTPHLYLNKEPPPEVLEYLESLAENHEEAGNQSDDEPPQFKASVSVANPQTVEYSKVTRPSILQRKKKRPNLLLKNSEMMKNAAIVKMENDPIDYQPVSTEEVAGSLHYTKTKRVLPICELQMPNGDVRRVRLLKLMPEWVEATGVRAGQAVTMRVKRRHHVEIHVEETEECEESVTIRMEDADGHVIEERTVTKEEAARIQSQVEEQHREMLRQHYGPGTMLVTDTHTETVTETEGP